MSIDNSSYSPEYLTLSEDPLWIAKQPVGELLSILVNPVQWCLNYGHVLSDPFTISIQGLMLDTADTLADSILIQSIDKTGLMTIQASDQTSQSLNTYLANLDKNFDLDAEDAVLPFGGMIPLPVIKVLIKLAQDSKDGFDGDKFKNRPIDITAVEDEGRAFAHLQIWTADATADDPTNLASKLYDVAQFHVYCATQAGYLDDVLNSAIPNANTQIRVLPTVGGTPNSSVDASTFDFSGAGDTVPMLYLGSTLDKLDDIQKGKRKTLLDSNVACELLVAEYEAGEITYAQAYSKPYY